MSWGGATCAEREGTVPQKSAEATLSLASLYHEVEGVKAQAEAAEADLATERKAHEATKKALAAALAREAKLKARVEQKGPVDSESESWLMANQVAVEWRRSPTQGEGVRLRPRKGGLVRAATLDAALAEARKRFGG